MRIDASAAAAPTAYVEPNVVATVMTCNGRWCRVSIGDLRGYVEQVKLWGVYPNEVVK